MPPLARGHFLWTDGPGRRCHMNKVLLARQRKVRRVWMRQLLILLSVIGPGLITANVDNDATGITGYSLAGAQYGYGLLWAVVLVTISLAVVQEMVARMGVVTNKGLSDLIRERLGDDAHTSHHFLHDGQADRDQH